MKRITLLVVYDFENIIDDYLIYLITECKSVSDRFIVIVNGQLNSLQMQRLESVTDEVVQRENYGYDGGAFKDIILDYLDINELAQYDEMLFVNDSFYGPFYPFKIVVDKMKKVDVEYWGLIRSEENEPLSGGLLTHIQSFFLMLRKPVLCDLRFLEFWKKMPFPNNYEKAIRYYEIGLNRFLQESGYKGTSWLDECGGTTVISKKTNPFIHEFAHIILKNKCPIIKRKSICLSSWNNVLRVEDFVRNNTDYDFQMVWENWNRYDRNRIFADYSLNELREFCDNYKQIYVYGEGIIGHQVYDYINNVNQSVDVSFVVSDEINSGSKKISEIHDSENAGIIIGVGKKIQKELYEKAKLFFPEDRIFSLC